MKSKRLTRFLNPLLSGLLLTLLLAVPALADVATIVPDGVVGAGGWTGVTAGNMSDDPTGGGAGDGTYATITGTLDTFTVSMSTDAAYSGTTINSVTLWVRASVVGGAGAGERITFGTTVPSISTSGTNTLSDDPARDNFSFVPAGISTSGDVDSMEVAVNTTTLGGGEEVRIFEIWAVVDYTPVAAANELNACDSCHTQPPVEGASRNIAAGAVVGSHATHSAYTCTVCHPNNVVLNHRGGQGANGTEGQIDMLANIQGGTYSLGSAGFLQDNEDGTGLGTCSDISCHGGAATITPQWGTTGGLDCTSCHGAPPATNAHAAHYTAKGWTSPDTAGSTCANCHLDNTVTHTDVTDGVIELDNAAMTPSGASPAISCGSAPALGCHNGKATPDWNTTNIACTDCHTAGGADPADPTTGLHDETPTVSGVIHNPSDVNFSSCEDCHTATPSDNHWDGTAQVSAPIINFNAVLTGFVDGTPPTCASSCHSESGTSGLWDRKWHENSDLVDGSECAGCHGDWVSGWNGNVLHRTDADPQGTHGTGAAYQCKDCHGLESAANYSFTISSNDWGGASNHGNGLITINNDPAHTFARGTGGNAGLSGCLPCHNQYDGTDGALNQHSFATTGWTLDLIDGDVINAGCDSCHGGSGQYWPNGIAYPDREGRHDEHMAQLSAKLGFALPGTDAQQKQMCDYCHNDAAGAGGGGHNDSGSPAEPADIGDFNHIGDAAADVGGSWTDLSETCAVACHNNKITAAGTYGWNDAGVSTCTMCHTIGGAGTADPNSGLHNITPTVSGQKHDTGLTACATCHSSLSAMAPASTHINNSYTVDGAGNTDRGLFADYTDGAPGSCSGGLVGDAAGCHGTTNTGGPTPNGDDGTWGRKWSSAISSAADGSTECAGCHGDFTNGWNYSGAVAGNVDHARDWDTNNGAEVEANHDGTDKCTICHVFPAGPYSNTWSSGDHGNGTIDMNSTYGYTQGSWDCASACHTGSPDNDNHNLEDSGWNVTTIAGPAPSCTGCHNAHGTGSAGVGPDSPHSTDTIFASIGVTYSCEDCHTAHNSGTIEIPNNATVGINYTANGESGIALGSAVATGTTEADICWNCHDQNGNGSLNDVGDISEWGVNTDTNVGGTNYNFGTLNQKSWNGAIWTSATGAFSYKTANIQSTHTVNAAGASGVDPVGEIRCSYCHDVHDTKTGSPNGAPYLRGTWMGSPYLEDGAPQAGTNYTAATNYGPIPRGGTGYTETGGYYIDQNTSNNPVSLGWTADSSSLLCEMCHGDNSGAWDNNEIDNLNEFGTAANDWVGSNGHSNAVLGGNGSLRVNIYTESDRKPTDGYLGTAGTDLDGNSGGANGYGAGMPDMGYLQMPGRGFGLRGNTTEGEGFAVEPQMPVNRPYGFNVYDWGATVDDGSNQTQYHQFSCSKCHNPHASRLPRLMITNCLDTKQNSWDDIYTVPAKGTNNQAGSEQIWDDNANVEISNATSAQNCHRVKDPAFGNAGGSGWNTVTPW